MLRILIFCLAAPTIGKYDERDMGLGKNITTYWLLHRFSSPTARNFRCILMYQILGNPSSLEEGGVVTHYVYLGIALTNKSMYVS